MLTFFVFGIEQMFTTYNDIKLKDQYKFLLNLRPFIVN